MTDLRIEKDIWIKADPTAVFDALTSSEQMVKYFPLDKVTSSWRVDSQLTMQGMADGRRFTDYGWIRALDRPTVFAYTYWGDSHGTENHPEHHVSISYHLFPEAGGTRVDMVHSNLPSQDYRAVMNDAWDHLLGGLKAYIESAPT